MDKISVINAALANTKNNRVNLNDGTEEWQVADLAFGRAVTFLAAMHNWPFNKKTKLLGRVLDADNTSQLYPTNGFRLPPDLLHLVMVYYRPNETAGRPLTDYELIGDVLSCDKDSTVFAEYMIASPDDEWHPLATEILTRFVEVGCLRGLNDDFKQATADEAKIERLLMGVSPRIEQSSPAKNMYKSKIAAARRTRGR